jgi:hypothetical protein
VQCLLIQCVELKWTKTLESTIVTKVMSTTFAQKDVKGFS